MKKFTKQISSLLALLAAGGVTGSSVINAINNKDIGKYEPLAGDVIAYPATEVTPDAGVAVSETSLDDFDNHTVGITISQTSTSKKTSEVSEKKSETEPFMTYTAGTAISYPSTDLTPTAGVPIAPHLITDETSVKAEVTTVNPDSSKTTETEVNTEETTKEVTIGIGTFATKSETKMTTSASAQVSYPSTEITPTVGIPLAPQRGCGDIDQNGRTEITDLTTLSLYLLGDKDLDENQLIAADVTKDDNVDLADLPQLKIDLSEGKI